jgi:hypothetical protein
MSTARSEHQASERLHSARTRAKLARVGLSSESIQRFLGEVVEDDLHVRTILSLRWPAFQHASEEFER